MSSKIVPVDPTEEMRLAFGNQIRTGNYNEGTLVGDLCLGIWQAMIAAAPVVERKPGFHTCQKCLGAGALLTRMAGESETDYRARCKNTAPPELAELQATIAQLTAENERLKELKS